MKKRVITREWLVSQNIDVEEDRIYHTTKRYGRKQLKPQEVVSRKKYGRPQTYHIVGWYGGMRDGKQVCYSFLVHRIIYAWYKGSCPENLDIDHSDGISTDNRIDNLEPTTHLYNMRKRKGNGHNDSIYYGMFNLPDDKVDEYQERCREYKIYYNELIGDNKKLRELKHDLKNQIKHLTADRRSKVEELKSIYGDPDSTYKSEEYQTLQSKYKFDKLDLEYSIEQITDLIEKNVDRYKTARVELDNYLEELKRVYARPSATDIGETLR